jgi:hypothetical protein
MRIDGFFLLLHAAVAEVPVQYSFRGTLQLRQG